MIGAYEVGATLLIGDRATPALIKMLGVVNDLAAGFERLKALGLGMFNDTGINNFNRAMGTADRRVSGMIPKVEALSMAMKGLGESAAFAGVASGGAAGGRGGKGGAHGHLPGIGYAGMGIGGMGVGGPVGMGVLGAAIVGGMAAGQGLKMEDAINKMMVAMGLPVGGDFMKSSTAQGLQSTIMSASKTWGQHHLPDMEQAALLSIRSLAPLSASKRIALLPEILDFVGTEVTAKGARPEEAAEAGIALAHQLRDYTPEQISPMFKQFAQLSMASPASLSQLTRAFSYSLPLLTSGLGVDPQQLLSIGAVGSQMGLNTKAGTWIAQMASRSMPDVKGLTAHSNKARLMGLAALGLIDGKGNSTVLDGEGKLDILKELQTVSQRMTKMSPAARSAALLNAFGQQGARAGTLFSDPAVLANIMSMSNNLKSAPTTQNLQAAYAQSPQFKMNQAMTDLNVQMTKLGETLIPSLIKGVEALTGILTVIAKGVGWINDQKEKNLAGRGTPHKATWWNTPVWDQMFGGPHKELKSWSEVFSPGKKDIAGGAGGDGQLHIENLYLEAPKDAGPHWAGDLADMLKQAAQNTTSGSGSLNSPYLQGAGP